MYCLFDYIGHASHTNGLLFISILGGTLFYWRESRNDYDSILLKNNLLEAMFHTVGGGLWWKDKDHKIVRANKKFYKELLLAKDENEVIGKTGEQIALDIRSRGVEYTAGEKCDKSDIDCIKRGETSYYREDFVIDGKTIIWLVIKTPFYDNNGDVLGTIGSSIDITDEYFDHKEQIRLSEKLLSMPINTKSKRVLNKLKEMIVNHHDKHLWV
jgi:PAS domain S-box-containing protein